MGSSSGALFAQALAAQLNPVGVVNDPIEDGVGQRWVAHDLVPAIHRKLTGDDQRAGVVAIFDDLEQVALLLRRQRLWPPIVQDQQIDAAQMPHQLGVTTIASCQCQRRKQTRDALVENREVLPAGFVAEGASKPRFSDAARTGQETVPMFADPIAAGKPMPLSPSFSRIAPSCGNASCGKRWRASDTGL